MLTNCGNFNEGAVVSGNINETDAILIRLKGIYRLSGQLCNISK